MKVSGYQIRESLARWVMERDTLSGQFSDSLFFFPEDKESGTKQKPKTVMSSFQDADLAVATLENVQQLYNQRIKCKVQGQDLSLAMCIKLVGGAGRRAKMWRDAASQKQDRYGRYDDRQQRSKDTIYAERAMTPTEIKAEFDVATRYASALRNAIARGNSQDVDLSELGLEDSLFAKLFE